MRNRSKPRTFQNGDCPTVAVVNDCLTDSNGNGRIGSMVTRHFCRPAGALIAVDHTHEAAINLVDQLAVLDKSPGVIVVNIAPRDKTDGKRFRNGTHFGYFWAGNTLVVSTISGFSLSLIRKFQLAETIHVLDLEKSADMLVEKGRVSRNEGEIMKTTQFRSCFFQIPAAAFLAWSGGLPSKARSIEDLVPEAPRAIYHIDCFGNMKTSLTKVEIGNPKVGEKVETRFGNLPFYPQLCQVPEGTTALILGSSGYGVPLVEIVTNGAGRNPLRAQVGDLVLDT
ncbi:MAG: hypothetical protein AAB511_02490 [Patescibacteria group bacterium]